jgi:RNA polymerase sigma factor (sigma-70 family)
VSTSPGRAAPSADLPSRAAPEARFDELYRWAGASVLGYALSRCTSRDDALDVTADTFLVAWRRRSELPDDAADARAWLFGVARGCLLNRARGQRRSQRLGQRLLAAEDTATLPDPARIHEGRSHTRDVRRALDALPPDDRELVTLTAWEGLTPCPGRGRSRPDSDGRTQPPAPRPTATPGRTDAHHHLRQGLR